MRNREANASLAKAAFLVSKAEALPPGIVKAGADRSNDDPSESRN